MIVELGITHVNPNLHLYIFSYLILASSLHVILFYFVLFCTFTGDGVEDGLYTSKICDG